MSNSIQNRLVITRNATKADLDKVVLIHCLSFKGFFLTSLGPKFLFEMYSAFMKDERYVFSIVECDHEVVGFSVGVSEKFSFSTTLGSLKKLTILLALVPALLRNIPVILPKVIARYRSSDTTLTVPHNTIVLKSIGVSPSAQGTGASQALLQHFEQQSLMIGYQKVLLTTDIANNERVIKFYRKCGYVEQDRVKQDSSRAMLVFIKEIGNTI